MKQLLLVIFGLTFNLVISQPWVFNPQQTTTKVYNGSVYNLTANQSVRTDYTYVNGRVDHLITKIWNGSAFIEGNGSAKIEYFYVGDNLSYTIIKIWSSGQYVLVNGSSRTDYYYDGSNRVDYTITRTWDVGSQSWIMDCEWLASTTRKLEYYYTGDLLDHQILKFWDCSDYYIGYTQIALFSYRLEYFYSAGKLNYTISKYYDGSNWYIGHEYVFDISVRTEYYYNGDVLDYTITKHYDGTNWFVGFENISQTSMKTEYVPTSITNVDDLSKSEMIIYPNPVKNILNIFSEIPFSNEQFNIFDASGVLVHSGVLSEQGAVIDVQYLSSGFYVIITESNRKMRFIKE